MKNKVRQTAFNYLKQMKVKHSKMDNLAYEKLEISKYLNTPMFAFKKYSNAICYEDEKKYQE